MTVEPRSMPLTGQATPQPLRLDAATFHTLLKRLGPSLGLWRAAEIAVLRTAEYGRPILDLGCGDGIVSSMVVDRIDIGLDPNRDALERARERGVYDRLIPAAVEQAGLPDASVATILSNSVLEHVPEIDRVFLAVSRLLQPGGRLIFTTPTAAFSRMLALPGQRYAGWRNRHLEHRNLWPVERWAQQLDRAGLEVEMVQPYLRPGLVRLWDVLELAQQVWFGRHRLFSLAWRRLPASSLDRLAQWAAGLDLASAAPGGGRLIVARQRVR